MIKRKNIPWILILLVILGGLLGCFLITPISRNNPLNVKSRTKSYFGVASYDTSGLAIFSFWLYGLLGGLSVIKNYQVNGNSISSMLNAYAPSSDNNDTLTYINNVSTWSGIDQDQTGFDVSKVAYAMTRQEIGSNPIPLFYYYICYYFIKLINY